jgi:hypothetical protein
MYNLVVNKDGAWITASPTPGEVANVPCFESQEFLDPESIKGFVASGFLCTTVYY